MAITLETTLNSHSSPIRYIPALGFGSLTPLFDVFQKWAAREETFKPQLTAQAKIQENLNVLDLGCGTGTLALLIKKSQPSAKVTGIDIDPRIIKIAKEKAFQSKLEITFDLGSAFDLPYPDNSFDRVVSSLIFHHLTRENKLCALREVYRVLNPKGELHIADMGKPQNLLMRLPSAFMRRLEETEDNVKGLLPQMINKAGFNQVQETTKMMTVFGTISFYKGIKD